MKKYWTSVVVSQTESPQLEVPLDSEWVADYPKIGSEMTKKDLKIIKHLGCAEENALFAPWEIHYLGTL